eukprot:scaffold14142_cov94-Isochrysis_galbana.AAC.4
MLLTWPCSESASASASAARAPTACCTGRPASSALLPPNRRIRDGSWRLRSGESALRWSGGGCQAPASPKMCPTLNRPPKRRGAENVPAVSATRHGAATTDSICIRPNDSGIEATDGMDGMPPAVTSPTGAAPESKRGPACPPPVQREVRRASIQRKSCCCA